MIVFVDIVHCRILKSYNFLLYYNYYYFIGVIIIITIIIDIVVVDIIIVVVVVVIIIVVIFYSYCFKKPTRLVTISRYFNLVSRC